MALNHNRTIRRPISHFDDMKPLLRAFDNTKRRVPMLMAIKAHNFENRGLVDTWDSIAAKRKRLAMIRAAAKRMKI